MRIAINGVDITDYIKYQGVKWSRNDIDGVNAGRNLAGTMIRDRVSTKIRMDITCRPLTWREHQILMNLLMPEFVTVAYTDPLTGSTTSKVMYANNHDSTYTLAKRDGIAFPLIEK